MPAVLVRRTHLRSSTTSAQKVIGVKVILGSNNSKNLWDPLQQAPCISSQVVIVTKFKLTKSFLTDKTIFPAWERDRTGKKSVSEDRERQIAERRAWECDRVQLTNCFQNSVFQILPGLAGHLPLPVNLTRSDLRRSLPIQKIYSLWGLTSMISEILTMDASGDLEIGLGIGQGH